MDLTRIITLAEQLARTVQELQVAVSPLDKARLAAEVNALRTQLGSTPAGPELVALTGGEVSGSSDPEVIAQDAREWFRAHLQGRLLDSPAGPVAVSSVSWRKVKDNAKRDTLRMRLLPAIPAILARGVMSERRALAKPRDRFIAFRFFHGAVALPGLTVDAGVMVGEEADGRLLYSLTHEMSVPWQQRNAPAGYARSQTQPDGGATGEGEPTLDGILPDGDQDINLTILRVLATA